MAPSRVVLASSSPQRREILGRLGIDFEALVPDAVEVSGGDPESDVLENARRKARQVARAVGIGGDGIVIACDTDVVLDGAILGKPEDEAAAADYLERLSGRSHDVVSGLVVLSADREREGVERSTVGFRALDSAAVERYVATGEWRGRAGGYAIQGWGSALVESVDGDVLNVIGLPVRILAELAPELGPGSR